LSAANIQVTVDHQAQSGIRGTRQVQIISIVKVSNWTL